MKVAIIGGGFTGLAAAYFLTQKNHQVTLFEKEAYLGGLAAGFKAAHWNWSLEKSYHHFFTSDTAMLDLIKKLGLQNKLILNRPITANYLKGTIYQLDSPLHLMLFPGLSLIDKLRTACLLAFLKLNPFWQPLENVTAKDFFIRWGGSASWRILWEPLMVGKFDDFASTVAASWFWARIKKRTPRLGYITGGFQTLIDALAKAITDQGGILHTNSAVTSIKSVSRGKYLVLWKKQKREFDRILLTVPTAVAIKLCPLILNTNTKHLLSIPHLHAQTLVLETKEPVLKNAYWLNITDRSFPFLAVVAHTNFIDKKHYGNHHITYFGNYLPDGHPYLSMNKEKLLKEFLPFIKRLNPSFRQLLVISYQLSVGWYAQPVHQLHYSQKAPKLKTELPGVFLANLDSIYPWDRGTNYAIELGYRAARAISE